MHMQWCEALCLHKFAFKWIRDVSMCPSYIVWKNTSGIKAAGINIVIVNTWVSSSLVSVGL